MHLDKEKEKAKDKTAHTAHSSEMGASEGEKRGENDSQDSRGVILVHILKRKKKHEQQKVFPNSQLHLFYLRFF